MEKVTKKQRKLLRGGNAMVKLSMATKNKIGDYFGKPPVYFNNAKPQEVANFVKIRAGIPFVKPELHRV